MIDFTPPNRVYSQYVNSPKLLEWLDITRAIGAQVNTKANFVTQSYDIESNLGSELDVIGRVVGVSRDFVDNISVGVFQFNPQGDYQFGDTEIQFSAPDLATDEDLNDEYFKRVIYSQIHKNNSDVTSDDVLTAIQTISPQSGFNRVQDNGDMTVTIFHTNRIDEVMINLINNSDIIPLPQCVSVRDFVMV